MGYSLDRKKKSIIAIWCLYRKHRRRGREGGRLTSEHLLPDTTRETVEDSQDANICAQLQIPRALDGRREENGVRSRARGNQTKRK